VPNGNPRRNKLSNRPSKAVEGAMDEAKEEKAPSDKKRQAWRSVLRQRIKKKQRARRKNGWSETPSVLCAGGIDSITYVSTHALCLNGELPGRFLTDCLG
jgi:hypothetical protein